MMNVPLATACERPWVRIVRQALSIDGVTATSTYSVFLVSDLDKWIVDLCSLPFVALAFCASATWVQGWKVPESRHQKRKEPPPHWRDLDCLSLGFFRSWYKLLGRAGNLEVRYDTDWNAFPYCPELDSTRLD
jgi:hypothetical protein